MIDPRSEVIQRRLAPIRRILAFSSAKGGVGKSLCAALSALTLSRDGFRTGLLDLDFQGASAHILLGSPLAFPEEASGLKPLAARESLRFMSFAAFSGERAVPLRGREVTEALLELLAVIQWGPLDFLVLDLPPGIGDAVLDVLRFLRKAEFVVVATPSPLVLRVVERFLGLVASLRLPLLGVVENMAPSEDRPRGRSGAQHLPDAVPQADPVAAMAERAGTSVLGSIPYLPDFDLLLERSDPLRGPLGEAMERIVRRIVGDEDSPSAGSR